MSRGTRMNATAIARPLVERFVPGAGAGRAVALACFALFGSLILWASAKISVPFWPVPMTLQTGAVALLAAAYGWRLGLGTVLLYLAEGAVGLPVFEGTPAKGIGLAYMAGPTGGYLIGFAFAAAIVGWLAERGFDRHPLKLFGAMLIGDAWVFALGLLWLGSVIGWDKPVLSYGLYPFILGDLAKLALAACLVSAGARLVRRP
jgi:biotin transport system substrate-specific component